MSKITLLFLLTVTVNIFSVSAQWETKSPADQTMDEIQTEYAPLPSEQSLRASRPIDDKPIGGAELALSDAPYLWLVLVGGVYCIARYRRSKFSR